MKRSFFLLGILVIAVAFSTMGQAQPRHRILIMLNSSSSMSDRLNNSGSKYQAAARFINNLVDSLYLINDEVEFGLRAFGHQYAISEHNCFDTKSEVMFSKDTRAQIFLRLKDLKQRGISPLEYSLTEAARDDLFSGNNFSNSLIIITDDHLTCETELCNTMKLKVVPYLVRDAYVVNIGANPSFRDKYGCLGYFLPLSDTIDMDVAITQIVSAYRKLLVKKEKQNDLISGKRTMKPVVSQSNVSSEIENETGPHSAVAVHNARTVQKTGDTSIVIRKGSRIKINTPSVGHLHIINQAGSTKVMIYDIGQKDSTPIVLDNPHDVKIPFRVGRYKLIYSLNGYEFSTEFKILAKMITDVRLK